ncbi:MAG TPA: type II toxin-antitoxin system RelE/ParE family toxin [Phycisphaerae bacterium]|nr:type II toxin-antitoxin system RelE/ParE family toxin [Phycisphaerae bacterium]
MPRTEIYLYRTKKRSIPLRDWLDDLPAKVHDKCIERIEELERLGYRLRRPKADYLRDKIYELRVKRQNVNYRMLYFYHGKGVAILCHGLTKEKEVPEKEIELAIRRMNDVVHDPTTHAVAFGEEQ